ncbi:MAG TPA: DsbA family protein [Ramlibacter sp.]|nr:DsbA family protein [Ramlibacter sp.]
MSSSTAAPTAAPVATLHYIYDPLCGWCYAAAPLVQAARSVPGLAIAFHGGGMLAGASRRTITADWREHVLPHDRRIAQLTNQTFGAAYLDGLLRDVGAPMDSEPPIAAALAAQALAGRGLDMIDRLQRAHYVEGRRIAEPEVLVEMAATLGLDADAFGASFAGLVGEPTRAHIAASRQLMARVGGQGFPTFALEQSEGRFTAIDTSAWLGRADAWRSHLADALGATAAA